MSPRLRLIILRIIALICVIGVSVSVFLVRDRAEEFMGYGYLGVFVVAFLAYATVLLPAPAIAIAFTWGSVFHPVGVALAAGAGATLGETVGYLAGFSGQVVLERVAFYQRLTNFMRKNGPLTIFLLSSFPNPLFDVAGAAAGALKMPLPKFLFSCWLGQTVKMFFISFAGSTSLGWIFK
mgnify:CR=1 FL=1